MRAARQKDTSPELALRSALHKLGLRYRVDHPVLPGFRRRADIVFTRAKVAVFVDGCFWHGCPRHGTWPKHNAAWWRKKIETNKRRDAETNRLLQRAGWRVARVWEHADAANEAERIRQIVEARTTAPD